MDTRSKIISGHEARARLKNARAVWVSGYFDPLLAEHVRRLRQRAEPGRPLVVEVMNPTRPLLPQRARAELVAALSMVDYVVLGNGEPAGAAADPDLTERFVERVLRRRRQETGA